MALFFISTSCNTCSGPLVQFDLDVLHHRLVLEVRAGMEYPAFVFQIVYPVAFQLELFQYRRFLETAAAPLAGAHEKVQPLLEVADVVGGGFEFRAHRDRFLGTHLRAAPTVGAAAAEILQDSDLLANVEHENLPR